MYCSICGDSIALAHSCGGTPSFCPYCGARTGGLTHVCPRGTMGGPYVIETVAGVYPTPSTSPVEYATDKAHPQPVSPGDALSNENPQGPAGKDSKSLEQKWEEFIRWLELKEQKEHEDAPCYCGMPEYLNLGPYCPAHPRPEEKLQGPAGTDPSGSGLAHSTDGGTAKSVAGPESEADPVSTTPGVRGTATTPTPNDSLQHEAAGNLAFLLSLLRSGDKLHPDEEANARRVINELEAAAQSEDTARLDWLERKQTSVLPGSWFIGANGLPVRTGLLTPGVSQSIATFESLREAIDRARKEGM